MVNFSATMAARAPALEADIAREHFLDYAKLKLIVERGLVMVSVDIPMYFARWRADERSGHRYMTFWEGLADAMRCDRVSRDWAVWQEDVPWMSLYFTACVWASLWLAWAAPTIRTAPQIGRVVAKELAART